MIWGGKMPCRDPHCIEAYRWHYVEDHAGDDK